MAQDDNGPLFDGLEEHFERLQRIRQEELEEYKRKLEAEYEPERQRIRASTREHLEFWEKNYGAQVRGWRRARGWSQDDLADKLNDLGFEMHQTTVAKIERGIRPLRVAEAVALAQIFGVPPLSVFYGASPDHEPYSMESMREHLETIEQGLQDAEKHLEDAAKSVAYWVRQRAIAVDAMNRAALDADRHSEGS
ncbi:helix-turn-helix domain-containing protein [Nocardia sp. BMG51109]|uniref:helix-turn-helix domain-containing protein n=1 Tax=Nocardia sp. BMG51109 TaxID=1056816 RepID=UPI0004631389|nr:helix-turn-helix transcriptional regulator [Nocardia sp. BMG51109]